MGCSRGCLSGGAVELGCGEQGVPETLELGVGLGLNWVIFHLLLSPLSFPSWLSARSSSAAQGSWR